VIEAKNLGVPDHVTVPVYPVPAVVAVTGVAPVTGAVTPAMAGVEIVVGVGVGVGAGTGSATAPGAGTGTGTGTGANFVVVAEDGGEVPLLLIATTEKEYEVPGVKPEILAALI
jgi:hypothetical protein